MQRKPTKLKILEGNRGKRKLDPASEPQPTVGIPDGGRMPAKARAIWNQITPELDRLGLLSIVDGTSLAAACCGAADAKWADGEAAKLQSLISSGKGEQNDFYRLGILNALSKKGWQQWGNFSSRYGLDPASRGKLSIDPAREKDPLASAIFG